MIQINKNWNFAKLPELDIANIDNIAQLDLSAIQMTAVNVPHTWYEDGNAYEGAVIYTKKQKMDYLPHNRIFIQFEGADRWCRVYINNVFVGQHKGGYAAFAFDITEMCECNKENDITVLLDNRSWDTISPLAGDFTVFGGIYRNVNLIMTEETCFDRTYYGTDGVIVCTDLNEYNQGIIDIKSYLKGKISTDISISYACFNMNGECVVSQTMHVETHENHRKLMLENPELWNGTNIPNRYRFVAKLIEDDKTIDQVEKIIGFRKISLNAETGFYLNHTHMKIKGVAKHQDFAEVFNATTSINWEKDLSDLIDIGANSVRLSHYQHPQKMYELCDEAGLVVWAEIPFLKLSKSKEFYENTCEQLRELILQNIHHPSICFWGIQNEIAMFAEDDTTYEQVNGLNELVKKLDYTRISAGANLFCVKNDSELNRITDAVGYNIYFGWYYGEMRDNQIFIEKFHEDNPQIPLGITEYGVDCNLKYHTTQPKVKDYSEEFQALYHETVYPIFAKKDYIWGTYVWNLYDFSSAIRDEGGVKYKNCKGLITYDRKTKKDSFYYYKSQWSNQPFVKIAESRFVNRLVGTMCIKVYSNQKNVTLATSEVEQTIQSDTNVFLFENIKIRHGNNRIVVRSGQYTDQVCFVGVDKADESYVYVDENPGLNVKNWFIDAVEEEKMFPKGKYSIRESCLTLLESDTAMQAIEEFNAKLAKQMRERRGAMPLERVLYYMKKEVSDEQCKELNAALIKINKEK